MRYTRLLAACVVSFALGATIAASWKSIIMPRQPLTMHRHDHGRALIALTDGQLKVVNSNGAVITTYDWKAGRAYWLDADPPGQLHADVNETSKPIEVIVVELKKP
jgi:hypothetical protein